MTANDEYRPSISDFEHRRAEDQTLIHRGKRGLIAMRMGPKLRFFTALLASILSLASGAACADTSLSGKVETTKSKPLANVRMTYGSVSATTDSGGHFLLSGISAGTSVLVIDGRHASQNGKTDYGYFEAQVMTVAGQANALSFVSYLPKIDHAHEVTFPSPTTSEVVIGTPKVPNLQLHIPAGMIITGPDGHTVTKIGITPIPTNRTPFPLPQNVYVPIYFTAQPGSSTIKAVGGGYGYAQVYYPNYRNELPGARGTFWRYDPDGLGWGPYGLGTVNAAATQVVPDKTTRIYELTGAMFNGAGGQPDAYGPNPGGAGKGGPGSPRGNPGGGEPVDLSTGLFVQTQTDLRLSDVIPLAITRTYRQNDTNSRDFGVGMTLSYDLYLWSANQYQVVDLLMPDGGRVHYVRTSPGTDYASAVFAAQTQPGAFYQSHISWIGNGWNLVLQNGTVYVFGNEAPLQYIQDRFGNRTQLTRASGVAGNILQVTSPSGKWIKFTYNGSNAITQATDSAGRTVGYAYDSSNRLLTVTDPNSGVTTYTWDTTNNRVVSIKDPRGNTFVTNTFDSNGRVQTQTLADSGVTHFAYTLDGSGNVTEDDVTDAKGNVRKVTFNSTQYWLTDKLAFGTAIEQDFSVTRDPSTNYPLTRIDPLGRETTWAYDGYGNTTSTTALAGTSSAVTWNFTYSPNFNGLLTVTDPLSHTTTFQRNALDQVTAIVDANSNSTSFTYTPQSQIASVADALNNTTQFAYNHGDFISTTDPLSRTVTNYNDLVGRAIRITDPLGNVSSSAFDPINGIHQVTDPIGGVRTTNYDADGHIANFADPRGGTTVYTYDTKNHLTVRRDPLLANTNFTSYDVNDNLLAATDRKGQNVTYTYDALNRIITATYADGSVVTYTWDAGNRLTQLQDTVGGTITRQYDSLDRLTSETTPQGTVSYTYDSASRRTQMTVSGQSAVNYTYDNANRLTQITQGSSSVSLGYDVANRMTSETLPNGIIGTYSYDTASQLTGITYMQGSTTVGTLTYGYNADGLITSRGGTLFQSVQPGAVTSGTYDADNRLTNWTTSSGATIPSYDASGNLTSDGPQTFTWDARNRLTGLTQTGGGAAYTYDATGRRTSFAPTGGTSTSLLYDGFNEVQELQGGTPSATLVAGLRLDQRFSRTSGSTTSTYLTDNLGSTVALTNSSGTVQTSYAYDPYGVTTTSGAANTNSYQYTGRANDGATGLYYYRTRYYNPAWGRFMSEDLIGLSGGANLYRYAGCNPIGRKDALGLAPFPPYPNPFPNAPSPPASDSGPGGGPNGNGNTPNGPTPDAPNAPGSNCSALAGAAKAVWHSLDAEAAFGLGTIMFVAGAGGIAVGCIDPTPFEPATCALGVFGAGTAWAGGGVAYTMSGVIIDSEVLSDLHDALNCPP